MKAKVEDYKRFAVTLLIISFFFFTGSVLPKEGVSISSREILVASATVALFGSAAFFGLSAKYQKKADEEEY
ncbi:hypothetical protein AC622_05040 [Bacillus sp. FJAT-27916]|uniref:YrhC family protein n=1 Tax=Bacillus sp. FJAT-27916 TaxID=1679169 RepID=UPI000670EEBE|nr:YrhC family protein [Bacillus sp. FJAT-27916]KMY43684.1 hypothetical protein AC622_05040 [Bacillus sp. FJAT-27916]